MLRCLFWTRAQVRNEDELTAGLEWIDDDLGIRPPPPPYPEFDVGVISSRVLEGLFVVGHIMCQTYVTLV